MELDTPGSDDEALACLADLAASSGELHHHLSELSQRLVLTKRRHSPGSSYAQMMPLEDRLAMMEQISAALRALVRDGSRFRRLEARALYAEGLTMAQLATVLGVSRQRVSALLRDTEDPPQAEGQQAEGQQDAPGDPGERIALPLSSAHARLVRESVRGGLLGSGVVRQR